MLDEMANTWAPLLVDEYGQERIAMLRPVLLSNAITKISETGGDSLFPEAPGNFHKSSMAMAWAKPPFKIPGID